AGVVTVESHQGGQIEGRAEAGLPLLHEEAKAFVRLLRGAEACELSHRPQAAAVHRRMHAPRKGELPRESWPVRSDARLVPIERLDQTSADRRWRQFRRRSGRYVTLPAFITAQTSGLGHR